VINADASRGPRRLTAPFRAAALAAALVAVAVLPAPSSAASKPKPPPPRYLFAGVPWLVPADTALARLAERGYRTVAEAGHRDQIVCRGRLFEHDALITGHLDEQRRLVRWVILVVPRGDAYKWPDMRAVFAEVTREAEARYGAPRAVAEKFRFPYERGDTREDEALRDGMATVRWAWASKSGDRLAVEMGADVSVILTYECEAWTILEKARRAKRASDL
jgi:hypothetical protein